MHSGSKPPAWLATWARRPERCFCLSRRRKAKTARPGFMKFSSGNLHKRVQVIHQKFCPKQKWRAVREKNACGILWNKRRVQVLEQRKNRENPSRGWLVKVSTIASRSDDSSLSTDQENRTLTLGSVQLSISSSALRTSSDSRDCSKLIVNWMRCPYKATELMPVRLICL